ncbi:MAG: aminoacyl-histidine dipeptidase, partial [Desulfobacterales bacterium]|nr:aminoacyl-histidine dipeptidase [Desulfobacterales bacterium]
MHAKVPEITDCFKKINEFPRCSGNETALAAWLCEWAEINGYNHRSDAAGNLIIDVPASAGYETAAGVIFQAHMDMVCEKTPDSTHDFSKDPIRMATRGDWLTAESTSLGADNGAAIAIGMVLVTDPAVKHPPLELLFTVDEESGLNGAKELPVDFIKGSILLNVDSEDEGIFTVGCAGGIDTVMDRDFVLEKVPPGHVLLAISAGGMRGGHSGIDIAKHRANANKVLARLLDAAGKQADLRLASIKGGTKHNAIPREARATVALPAADAADVEKGLLTLAADIRAEYQATEPNLAIVCEQQVAGGKEQALTPADTRTAVACLMALPTGVIETVSGECDRVETSCNLAIVGLE